MRLITKQFLIQVLPERWLQQYPLGREEKRDAQYEKLISMENPTEEKIAELVGNTSWTRLQCDHCHNEVVEVIAMDVTRGEYATHICKDCLVKAVRMFQNRSDGT